MYAYFNFKCFWLIYENEHKLQIVNLNNRFINRFPAL